MNLVFKLSYLSSNFALGYLNPASNTGPGLYNFTDLRSPGGLKHKNNAEVKFSIAHFTK